MHAAHNQTVIKLTVIKAQGGRLQLDKFLMVGLGVHWVAVGRYAISMLPSKSAFRSRSIADQYAGGAGNRFYCGLSSRSVMAEKWTLFLEKPVVLRWFYLIFYYLPHWRPGGCWSRKFHRRRGLCFAQRSPLYCRCGSWAVHRLPVCPAVMGLFME